MEDSTKPVEQIAPFDYGESNPFLDSIIQFTKEFNEDGH